MFVTEGVIILVSGHIFVVMAKSVKIYQVHFDE